MTATVVEDSGRYDLAGRSFVTAKVPSLGLSDMRNETARSGQNLPTLAAVVQLFWWLGWQQFELNQVVVTTTDSQSSGIALSAGDSGRSWLLMTWLEDH
ncbi:hypothetical protein EMPG_15727 [Blastomyces silverae]|uniref:Uncharacterized protein n=1 Tax=Blastomyces silverae TaxID=2060906 RepID=A0A0H1BCM2_9EURO|nr:hypothetical protein EMPG_15727 [Blastomyces silverae]